MRSRARRLNALTNMGVKILQTHDLIFEFKEWFDFGLDFFFSVPTATQLLRQAVSWSSLCTKDKCLKGQLQATGKIAVSSLKVFFFLWPTPALQLGKGGEKKILVVSAILLLILMIENESSFQSIFYFELK